MGRMASFGALKKAWGMKQLRDEDAIVEGFNQQMESNDTIESSNTPYDLMT